MRRRIPITNSKSNRLSTSDASLDLREISHRLQQGPVPMLLTCVGVLPSWTESISLSVIVIHSASRSFGRNDSNINWWYHRYSHCWAFVLCSPPRVWSQSMRSVGSASSVSLRMISFLFWQYRRTDPCAFVPAPGVLMMSFRTLGAAWWYCPDELVYMLMHKMYILTVPAMCQTLFRNHIINRISRSHAFYYIFDHLFHA